MYTQRAKKKKNKAKKKHFKQSTIWLSSTCPWHTKLLHGQGMTTAWQSSKKAIVVRWKFSPNSVRSYWLLQGHMTSHNKTPAKRSESESLGNSAKSMISKGNSALLHVPTNVDQRPPLRLLLLCRCMFFFLCYKTNYLLTGPSGNSSYCFRRPHLGET